MSSVVLVMLAFSAFGGEVAQDEASEAVQGWATLEAFAPGAVAYQWYCDGEPIDGATGQTLDVSWSKSKEPAVYTARATFSRFGVPFTRDASATVTSLPKGLILILR